MLLTVLGQSSDEIKEAILAGTSKVLKCIESWVNEVIEASIAGDDGGGGGPEAAQGILMSVLECLDTLPMDLATLKRTGIGRVAGSLRKPLTGVMHGGGKGVGGDEADVPAKAKQLVEKWRRLADPAAASAAGAGGNGGSEAPSSKKAKTGPGRGLEVDVASSENTGKDLELSDLELLDSNHVGSQITQITQPPKQRFEYTSCRTLSYSRSSVIFLAVVCHLRYLNH